MEDVDSRFKMGWGLCEPYPPVMSAKGKHSGWLQLKGSVRTIGAGTTVEGLCVFLAGDLFHMYDIYHLPNVTFRDLSDLTEIGHMGLKWRALSLRRKGGRAGRRQLTDELSQSLQANV